jgi:NADPH:quinone reductase-like Zn-dependent oxidoreductase
MVRITNDIWLVLRSKLETPMHAAVVTSFSAPPRYADRPDPIAHGPNEVVVDVLAVGLHPRVRSQADGSHYTRTAQLPLVPGVDAVVRDPVGHIRYAVLEDSDLGTMAERTVIDLDRSVVLPADIDPVRIAAAMNPAMSAWMALRRRIDFRSGQQVLVLGATGNAGRIAVQIAKHFGASQVIAAGRDTARLAPLVDLGADRVCMFDQLASAADVDIVLDYVWGAPTARALVEILSARHDRGRPLTWIEIGSVAGPDALVPSAALRSARLDLIGSGIGAVPGRDFVEELPNLAAAVGEGNFDINARAVPLADVERVWSETTSDRIVFVP